MHTPSRVLTALESLHSLDRKVDALEQRLSKVESDVLNLPHPPITDFRPLHHRINHLHSHLDQLAFLSGKIKCSQLPSKIHCLSEAEFKVFSQFGDDGIIEYLVSVLNIEQHKFVEFGVESYMESNTRFLMQNRNWSGLILDGGADNIDWIKAQDFYWRHDLTAVCAFIDAANINQLIADSGFSGPIGILSVDIDGNDYWVWKAINVVDPVIVISEFNSTFGSTSCVTVPYNPEFERTAFHHSNLYWGASLGALRSLAKEKGYSFIGCNAAGNNAYFVRNSHVAPVAHLVERADYVPAKFRESRDESGLLTFAKPGERMAVIGELEVFDINELKMRTVSSLPQ